MRVNVTVTFYLAYDSTFPNRICKYCTEELEGERSPGRPPHPIRKRTTAIPALSATYLTAASFDFLRSMHCSPSEAMAQVTIMVAAIATAIAVAGHFAAAAPPEPFTIDLAIQNNFQAYNLTVQCDSDLEAHADAHLVPPEDTYQISFDSRIPHQWMCTLSARRSQASYEGRFVMWQNHMPIPPMREPMCEDRGRCPWFVDAHGLSLVRHPRGEPLHVYDWPAQESKHLGPEC